MTRTKKPGLWSRLTQGFKDSAATTSLEAEFYPPGIFNFKGEALDLEYKEYLSGRISLVLDAKRALDVPVGETIEIWINEKKFREVEVTGERRLFHLNSAEGDKIPKIARKDKAEVRHQGRTILESKFKTDD